MKRATSARVPIDRPAQLRALASPVRQELLDVLISAGPCSIAELGRRLGRAPDALYFHVRRLMRVGLVVEAERRKVGRHAFVMYDALSRELRIDRSRARPDDLEGVVGGILRLAMRDYRRGLGDPETVVEGPGRNHWGGRVRGWLDEGEIALANELLEKLGALIRGGRPGHGRQALALAWVLAPVPARRRTSAGSAARPETRQEVRSARRKEPGRARSARPRGQ